MTGELTIGTRGQVEETRWGIMLAVSVILHVSVFSAAIFLPNLYPSKDIDGIVYEVDLVQMSSGALEQSAPAQSSGTSATEVKAETSAKRIETKEVKKTDTSVEKISTSTKKTTAKKKETTSTEKKTKTDDTTRLNNAISKIRKQTTSEEDHLEKAMSQLRSDTGGTGTGTASETGTQGQGKGEVGSLSMRIYQINVKSHIQSNWAYPAAMQNRKDLEVTVLLRVKEDGTIIKTEFIKKSKDSVFDQSVLKAIERSNPIPPFPEGYEKSYEQFEIRFTLKELMDS